jgi:molecular chaperone GrpE
MDRTGVTSWHGWMRRFGTALIDLSLLARRFKLSHVLRVWFPLTASSDSARHAHAFQVPETMTDSTEPTQGMQPDTQADGEAASAATDALDAAVMSTEQREINTLNDRLLRTAAEYDNFRRRAAKERQEAGWRAQGDLVRGILDAIDDITRFAHVDPTTLDAKTVVDGVLMVEKKLFKSLAGHGFETIDATGQLFDPTRHEAVSTAPAQSAEEDGIVAVTFQVGYVINGHVLRPARVVVKQWTGAAPLVS